MTKRVKEFHSIMPIANVASVLEHGILSHNRCMKLPHADISMADVQDRRRNKQIPNGLNLHDYANLYFCARNPMMYIKKDKESLCVLRIATSVYKQDGVVFTDRNASSDYVRFLSPGEVNEGINFDWVFADYWTDENPIEKMRKKSTKCAEILIPNHINPDYIKGAYVISGQAKDNLRNTGFNLPIDVKSYWFFR